MTSPDLLETLRGVGFLHGISDDSLTAIAPIADQVEFPAGGVIFWEGQRHTHIYLILQGSVALEIRVSQREVKRFQTVGELLGWSPLLGEVEMTATARALRPTRAVAIAANQLLALGEQNPKLGLEFMKRIAQALSRRLAATRLQLTDVYSQELPGVPSGQEG
jgi:CRP-like cAMP-binding protein